VIPHFKISDNELSCIFLFSQASYVEALRKSGLVGAKAGQAFRHLCNGVIKCNNSIKEFTIAIANLKRKNKWLS